MHIFFLVRRRPCLSLLAGITVCTGAYLTHSRSWQPECQLGTTSKWSPLRMYTLFYVTQCQTSAACWAHVSQQSRPALAVQAPRLSDLLSHRRPQISGHQSPPSRTSCNTRVTLVSPSRNATLVPSLRNTCHHLFMESV